MLYMVKFWRHQTLVNYFSITRFNPKLLSSKILLNLLNFYGDTNSPKCSTSYIVDGSTIGDYQSVMKFNICD